MVYMGAKSKYAKHIVPILQKCIDENNIDTYIECFCLSQDTKVYTKDDIVEIKDLQIGDYIYDEKGELAKVVNKVKSPKKKGKKITLKGNIILKATDEHKFYLKDSNKEITTEEIKKAMF